MGILNPEFETRIIDRYPKVSTRLDYREIVVLSPRSGIDIRIWDFIAFRI